MAFIINFFKSFVTIAVSIIFVLQLSGLTPSIFVNQQLNSRDMETRSVRQSVSIFFPSNVTVTVGYVDNDPGPFRFDRGDGE